MIEFETLVGREFPNRFLDAFTGSCFCRDLDIFCSLGLDTLSACFCFLCCGDRTMDGTPILEIAMRVCVAGLYGDMCRALDAVGDGIGVGIRILISSSDLSFGTCFAEGVCCVDMVEAVGDSGINPTAPHSSHSTLFLPLCPLLPTEAVRNPTGVDGLPISFRADRGGIDGERLGLSSFPRMTLSVAP
jgi:hypothetical protein